MYKKKKVRYTVPGGQEKPFESARTPFRIKKRMNGVHRSIMNGVTMIRNEAPQNK